MSVISSINLSAWARVDADTRITYHVAPDIDTAEFDLGGRHGLALQTSEAGLRRFIAVFTAALGEFTTAATAQPEAIPSEYGAEPA